MSFHRGRGRSYHGNWRGVPGRGGRAGDAWSEASLSSNLAKIQSLPSPSPKPLGPILDKIGIGTLLVEENTPTIGNVEYVASYNWLDVKSPIIMVPGSPPAWTPPATDPQLKPDSEDVFRDVNAARFPSYPFEPTIRSLQTMRPDFDLQSVDIVGCGSTIGNLLRFAGSQSKPFRFDVDVIGDTVFFVRKESSPTELIKDLRGYGHTFPQAYTTWDMGVRNSCSHQRIIRYNFGSLHFLVRTETDGYIRKLDAETSSSVANLTNKLPLEDVLSTMAVTGGGVSPNEKLQVRIAGTRVPQDQIFDLKTRASHRPFDMNEILPRLWVNQTSKFLIAYHKFGLFEKAQVKDVEQDVLGWEKASSALLARFHTILKRIVDVARDPDNQQCEVSWDGQGPLCVTKQTGEVRRALPPNLLQVLKVQ